MLSAYFHRVECSVLARGLRILHQETSRWQYRRDGALQANVEATAAKFEEAAKQQDQKNKALVQLSPNAAKKAMAATSAADAAAHGIEVMGQRLNRNAEADLKRFGKQKAQIDNLNAIVNK